MPPTLRNFIFLSFLFVFNHGFAQSVFQPGDAAIIGVASNLGLCGFSDEGDQISFFFYKDLEMGTQFDITDNGWENSNAGLWGDGEGTLKIWRTGPDLPAGTIITLETTNWGGGNWEYDIVDPADGGWLVGYFNGPGMGGPFNIDDAGDQIYLLQSPPFTPWDNNGAGGDDVSYNCRFLFGFSTTGTWSADGSPNGSNLHPSLDPCYHMEAPGEDFAKYVDPYTTASVYDWITRIVEPANWNYYPDCASFLNAAPDFLTAPDIPMSTPAYGVRCPMADCDQCPPYQAILQFLLPAGTWDVVYTDGTEIFTLNGAVNFDFVTVHIDNTVTYEVLSLTPSGGGCPVPEEFITSTAYYFAPDNNAGMSTSITVCPDYGPFMLFPLLGPDAEPGGEWYPPLDPLTGQYYVPLWGPGTYYYVFLHGECPPDTASVTIYHVNLDETIIDIGCDVNGTPFDITDDVMTIDLTVLGQGFGATYKVWVERFHSPYGSITPETGTTGVSTLFYLNPGSATETNLELHIMDHFGFLCEFDIPLPPPGFCSDPCDQDMFATISGDEEICLNSCPDAPAQINIEVFGGNEPYSMDFAVSAPGFPTVNFTGVEISDDHLIEVCVDSIPQPVYDASSAVLILPAIYTGIEVSITLVNVYAEYECLALLDNPTHTITIYPLPAIMTTSFEFCRDVAININLTDYDQLISPFLDVTWYDGNPLQGGDNINNPTGADLENVVELWAHVEDDHCENSIRVPFIILPQPQLDSVPPVEVCIGGVVVLESIVLEDFGNSMATYTYHAGLPPDSTNLLDPTYWIPPDSTTIYVHATGASGMCFDTLPIKINVQDYPDFSLQGLPCDFIANTYSVLFTSTADSIHTNFGTIVNNPVGQDAINGVPNDSTVIIELISASGLCKDTFLIVAPNCNCPTINPPVSAQPSYSICEDVAIPVLTVTVDPGLQANWYDVPSGGVALLSNSLTYQPPSAVSSNFYVESFDPATSCYSIRTQIPLTVYQLGDVQNLADPQLCEAETIDFNTFIPNILNGIPGSGQWFELSTNLPVSGVVTPSNGDSWYYLFTSNPGNCQSSDTLVAIVHPLPFINVFNVICDEVALTYDMDFTSNADALLASVGSITNVSGTDTFHLDNIPFDTDVQFSLEITASGCMAALTLPAPNCSCPALLNGTDHEACSDQGNIDLSTFEGAGVNGTWQMVSTPAGANPATLSGSNFLGLNRDDGVYVLRFIRSIILADCVDTAAFTLTLNQSPFADAGIDGTSCAPDQILLSGTANASGVQTTWQTTGSGSIANPNSLNTNYTPTLADITAGSVNFTLTATDPSGACPDDSETITIDIDGSAYFILSPTTLTHCDTSDLQVDLDDLVSFGTTGGTWFFPDTVSAPISGSSIFNPSDLSSGSYTVFYTTSNAVPPCENDTVGVTLIIENCECPSVALSTPNNDLCSDAATQNLSVFQITTESGSWSIVNEPAGTKPAVITGSDFITNGSDAGTYTLRFTLSNPVAGCLSFAEIDIVIVSSPTAQIVSATCADDLLSWEAVITSTAEEVSSSSGSLTSLGNNQYLIDNITINTNLQITIENGNGLCTDVINIPSPDCDCTLDIADLPVTVSLCPDENITLQATVTGGKGVVTSYWIDGNDTIYQTSLNVNQSGSYQFVSTDELGCKEERTVVVDYYTEMVPNVNSIDINCPGDNDGQIIIEAIAGGTGPYTISVNNGSSQTIGTFPFILNNLSGGNYQIEFTDASNCVISISVPIQSASSESIDLGPDQVILVGDSVYISPSLSFIPDSFYWTGDISLLDQQKLDKWIAPDVDQTFTLSGIDAKGCLYRDDLTIRVLLTSNIFVPNVFSPNDDGFNDFIAPSADASIISIEYFEIFSRWGELVYAAKDFTPGDQNYRWDGMRDEKPYQQGVYAYRLSATNKRGTIITLQGDITLIR